MSLYTLPFLYLNLGGEMVYILQQRLKAQKINEQKQKKGVIIDQFHLSLSWSDLYLNTIFLFVIPVMQDIVRHMLSDSVLSTLFTAQPITTTKRLRTNFTKLANTSIINLNENSMDKVYNNVIFIVWLCPITIFLHCAYGLKYCTYKKSGRNITKELKELCSLFTSDCPN